MTVIAVIQGENPSHVAHTHTYTHTTQYILQVKLNGLMNLTTQTANANEHSRNYALSNFICPHLSAHAGIYLACVRAIPIPNYVPTERGEQSHTHVTECVAECSPHKFTSLI